jgi:hypothetical protein
VSSPAPTEPHRTIRNRFERIQLTLALFSFIFCHQFVTTNGLGEFIYYLSQYDANNPFGDYYNADDYGGDDDNAYDGNYNDGYENLPVCEQGNNGYIGLGCADDGTFSLQYFEDEYCLQPSGKTYDRLRSLNRALKTYRNCAGIYYGGNDDNDGSSLPQYLIGSSDSCSSLDSSLCIDTSAMQSRKSSTGSRFAHKSASFASGGKSWVTKLKYATGGLLLLASFVMFTGILFTNRRRRRALMQRKYRQSKRHGSRKSSSRSKSRHRERKSSRSKSRSKKDNDAEGVFT